MVCSDRFRKMSAQTRFGHLRERASGETYAESHVGLVSWGGDLHRLLPHSLTPCGSSDAPAQGIRMVAAGRMKTAKDPHTVQDLSVPITAHFSVLTGPHGFSARDGKRVGNVFTARVSRRSGLDFRKSQHVESDPTINHIGNPLDDGPRARYHADALTNEHLRASEEAAETPITPSGRRESW